MKPSLNRVGSISRDYVQWEDEVTDQVRKQLESSRSEAQAVLDIRPNELLSAWSEKKLPAETAQTLIASVSSSQV